MTTAEVREIWLILADLYPTVPRDPHTINLLNEPPTAWLLDEMAYWAHGHGLLTLSEFTRIHEWVMDRLYTSLEDGIHRIAYDKGSPHVGYKVWLEHPHTGPVPSWDEIRKEGPPPYTRFSNTDFAQQERNLAIHLSRKEKHP